MQGAAFGGTPRPLHGVFVALRGPPCSPVRPERRAHLVGGSPTRAMVGWPGSWQAVRAGNRPGRSPATKAALGGRANRRAVTCVKPEQASKRKSWTPTQPKDGEGSTNRGSSRQTHPERSIGVRGTARRDRWRVSRGDPCVARVAASTVLQGIGPRGSRTGS